MPERDNLALHEEILLLALKNERGTTAIEGHHDLAMGGALLAELLLLGRIQVVCRGILLHWSTPVSHRVPQHARA